MSKKNIMFIANYGKEWIGGLYYVKNMMYSFTRGINSENINNINIFILTKKENVDIFRNSFKYKNMKIIIYNDNCFNTFIKKVTQKILRKPLDLKVLFTCIKFHINFIFPINSYPYLFISKLCINWIPDFQHIYLPELFSKEEIKNRDVLFLYIAKHHKKLVLSSDDAFKTYKKLFPQYTKEVYIIPFASYIEDELASLTEDNVLRILNKYNLHRNYLFIPNQFYMHKNHLTVFKAINYLVNIKNKDILLVCTGNTEDYRNKNYFNGLLKYIEDNNLENNILILGLINRNEQLAIMKNANLIIQPSLFEGWGTGVEDAKAMGKHLIISNINVHFEQANKYCIFFKSMDYIDLAEKIEENFNLYNKYNLDEGKSYISEQSKIYSADLFKLFDI